MTDGDRAHPANDWVQACKGRLIWPAARKSFHPRRVLRLQHSLCDHPLLQLSALRRLAVKFEEQNTGLVKFVRSGTTSADALEIRTKSDRGLSAAEAFSRIEEPGSWVSLYCVQTDPEYRELMRTAVEGTRSWAEAADPGRFGFDGFIFVSSAPSATPFHFDRENNFFLQIHGRKRLTVWDPCNRKVVPEVKIEEKIGGRSDLSTVRFEREFLDSAVINEELGPGDGVYMPSTAAHTTNTEAPATSKVDTYSISIGIVFYTRATRRAAHIYSLNDHLRRAGLSPRPPYQSPAIDALKYPAARLLVLAKRQFRGFKLPPGM